MSQRQASINLKVVALDPPFGQGHNILFGLQSRKVVETFESAIETTTFECWIDVVFDGATVDFKGPHVQGKKGDRFVYLSWGMPGPDEPFVMFARAKLKLGGVPNELLDVLVDGDGTLVCELQATNEKGQPASGTIKPPAISWLVLE